MRSTRCNQPSHGLAAVGDRDLMPLSHLGNQLRQVLPSFTYSCFLHVFIVLHVAQMSRMASSRYGLALLRTPWSQARRSCGRSLDLTRVLQGTLGTSQITPPLPLPARSWQCDQTTPQACPAISLDAVPLHRIEGGLRKEPRHPPAAASSSRARTDFG